MKKIFDWSILLFAFSIPLSPSLSIKLVILACILSFFVKNPDFRIINFFSKSWDLLLYLLLLIVGVLYSEDLNISLRVLETNFSILAMPIIFGRINLERHFFNRICFSFISGLLVAGMICLINALILYNRDGRIEVFLSYQLTEIINSHPTYLAYYIIFAITFFLYLFYYKMEELNYVVIVLTVLFLFLILMLTGGQTAYVSMLLIFSFFILKFLVEERSTERKIGLVLVCLMVVCMFLVNMLPGENSVLTDSWERFVLWESAIRATPDIIWGVGTGDYKEVLNNYYLTHGLGQYANSSYNSHNQFIQIVLTNGILALIVVLIMVFRPLYLAVNRQNVLGILILFPFLIYGMTEVFLGRYQGVVFFALLHQAFVGFSYSSKFVTLPLKGD